MATGATGAAGAAGVAGALPRVQAGYWIVDPGVAKQSQDWCFAGPSPRRASPPRASWWPVVFAAALASFGCALAATIALSARPAYLSPAALLGDQPFLAGLLAATALYVVATIWRLVRRRLDLAQSRSGRRAPSPSGSPTFDPRIPPADATMLPEVPAPAVADEMSEGLLATMGIQEDDLHLTDEEAGRRQAWEGEIAVDAPSAWPDRPLVVAIGDGVSSAARSAEMSRLATRTAWYRTFYHLHALATGAAPTTTEPWTTAPADWPAPGPERDQLLVRALCRAFADANVAVVMAGNAYRRQNPTETRPTATTLTLVAVDGLRYSLVHVGDCSVYHVRGASGEVEPRQVEHNQAASYAQLEPARYAERYAAARGRGLQNVLTRWIGMTADWNALDPQVLQPAGELVPGDALVLCSDGLDKHVAQAGIGRAVMALDAAPAARRLVGWANDRGGSDHVAVAVLHTRPPGAQTSAAARRALWREDLAVAWQRYRTGVVALVLAGLAVAIVVAVAGAMVTGLLRPTQLPGPGQRVTVSTPSAAEVRRAP